MAPWAAGPSQGYPGIRTPVAPSGEFMVAFRERPHFFIPPFNSILPAGDRLQGRGCATAMVGWRAVSLASAGCERGARHHRRTGVWWGIVKGEVVALHATVFSGTILGVDGFTVEVEVDLSRGIPSFSIVGLPNTAVRESRERVTAAIKNSGLEFPLERITVNLATAYVKK